MSEFVEVVVKATKRKQMIPAHWLEHPSLSEPFTKTPSARAAEDKAKAPAKAKTDKAPTSGRKED